MERNTNITRVDRVKINTIKSDPEYQKEIEMNEVRLKDKSEVHEETQGSNRNEGTEPCERPHIYQELLFFRL